MSAAVLNCSDVKMLPADYCLRHSSFPFTFFRMHYILSFVILPNFFKEKKVIVSVHFIMLVAQICEMSLSQNPANPLPHLPLLALASPSQPLNPPQLCILNVTAYNSEKWSKNIKLALPNLVLALLRQHNISWLRKKTASSFSSPLLKEKKILNSDQMFSPAPL